MKSLPEALNRVNTVTPRHAISGANDPIDRYGLEGLPDRLADVMALASQESLSSTGESDDWSAGDESGNAPLAYGQVGGYQLLGRLGQGGSGVVWRALQPGTGREVALKVLGPAAVGSDKARARFQREVELAASLEHPHVARVYEGGTDDGTDFCAMELIRGKPLDQFVAARHLARPEVLALTETVCRAVGFAHQHGVIHRDLKFSNILVSDDGAPHLVDFGLGRLLDEAHAGHSADGCAADGHTADARRAATLTIAGEVSGTVAFMSPEQAAGLRGADTRSDVYSLGVILYWLLTSQPPHDLTGSRGRVLRRIEEEDVRRPRQADPSINADLEALLLKALAKSPAERYGTAGEMADDLRRYLDGEPLAARPATAAYFLAKWVRRHKSRLATAAAVAALLLGTSVWSYLRIQRSRDWAIQERQRAENALRVAEEQRAIAGRHELRALSAEQLAETRQADAEHHRAVAEQRLADSLLAQAAAMGERRDLVRSKELYAEARAVLVSLGRPTLPADLGLLDAWRFAAPPLNRFAANGGAVGGAVGGAITATAFSPDGRMCASADDRAVRLWDQRTGRLLRTLTGHNREVYCLAFSPDGRFLLSGAKDQTARLWLVATGERLRKFDHRDEVRAVAFSSDGRRCITGSWEGSARVWDLTDLTGLTNPADLPVNAALPGLSPAPLSTFARHDGCMVAAVALSPDGSLALSGGGDGSASLWDAGSAQLKVRLFKDPEVVRAAAFSPDGKLAATGRSARLGSSQQTLQLWDVATGQLLRSLTGTTPHAADISAVAFSPDSRRLLSASDDGTVKLWDVATGQQLHTVWGDAGPLDHVSFSPDARLALSGGADGVAKLWDLAGDSGMAPHGGHLGTIHSISLWGAASPAARAASSATQPSSQPATQPAAQPATPSPAPAPLVALTAGADGWMRLWDLATGRELQALGPMGEVYSAALSPDGRHALCVAASDRVLLWDLSEGPAGRKTADESETRPGGTPHQLDVHLNVRSVAFSPDGKLALSASGDWVKAWDATRLPEGQASGPADPATVRPSRTLHANATMVPSLTFTADGRQLLSCSSHGAVVGWNWATGWRLPLTASLIDQGEIAGIGVAFTADGSRALAAFGRQVLLWDARSGARVHLFEGHRARATAVALSRDGRRGASAATDGTVSVLNLELMRESHRFRPTDGPAAAAPPRGNSPAGFFTGLTWSDDGHVLASGGDDGLLRVWDPGRVDTAARLDRAAESARAVLASGPDPSSDAAAPDALADDLAALGEWYAFRGRWDWAADLLAEASEGGAAVSSLLAARCDWSAGRFGRAEEEFRRAKQRHEAPDRYLDWCLRAVERDAGDARGKGG